jgi:hypothetical protein
MFFLNWANKSTYPHDDILATTMLSRHFFFISDSIYRVPIDVLGDRVNDNICAMR